MLKIRNVVLALLVVATVVPVAAQDLFSQAQSADRLRQATGLIWDTSTDDPVPHWTFDGEFALRCEGARCIDAALENIRFDLALGMVRPAGPNSHSHSFTDFVASDVMVVNDDLIITGTIVGTGGFAGLSSIIITIQEVSGMGTILLEFPGNVHIIGPVGGVVVSSR